jgi:hemolysin activation/secretion protein
MQFSELAEILTGFIKDKTMKDGTVRLAVIETFLRAKEGTDDEDEKLACARAISELMTRQMSVRL